MRARLADLLRRYWLTAFLLASLAYVASYLWRQPAGLNRALSISVVPLAFTVVAQVGFWLLASVLWRRLVQHSSDREIGLLESFGQLCVVNLGKYLPGKVWGMVARGARMRERHGIALDQIVGSTFLEQFFLMYAAGVVVLAGAGLLLDFDGHGALWALAAVAVFLLPVFSGYALRVMTWLLRASASGRVAVSTEAGMLIRDHYIYLAAYLGIWVLLGTVLYGLYLTFFSTSPDSHTFLVMVVAATVGYVAGFLAVFAPGGVGVREAVGSAVLVLVMPMPDAIMLSLIFRLWTVATEGIFGGIMLAVMRNSPSGSARR